MSDVAPAASRTALMALKQRALHYRFADEPRVLEDPVAERLLGGDFDGVTPQTSLVHTSVVLRSRWCEDRLALALQRGIAQFVILGAGFETFPYRQPDWARALRLYEVDHHASQAEKKRRLAAGGVAIPPNLEFVAIDFERTTLREGLKQSTLDFSRPTFFACLGVTSYLTRDAVDAIFRLVAEFPAGSEMVFNFHDGKPPAETANMVKDVGEPYHTYFEAKDLERDLRAMGFSEFHMLTAEEADRLYFEDRSDGLVATNWPALATIVRG